MTGKPSEEWLSPQKGYSLTSKYRKLWIKNKVYGNLWIRSTSESFQLLKPSSTIINHTLKFTTYGMCCIVHLIQLNIVLSMKGYLMKYCLFLYLNGMDFLRKNSLLLSLSVITLLFLDLINFLGVISNISSKTRCICIT